MSFSDQFNTLSKSCHFHIRDIRQIRHLLPLSAATALANSLVSSKLDYCNSLHSGISQTSTHSKLTGTRHYKHFKISTHHTNTEKTTLASNQTKNRVQTLSHTQNTYKSTLFLQDLLIHSFFPIPYVRSSHGKRAFSVIGPRLEFTTS